MCKFQASANEATAKREGEGKEQGLQALFNTIQEHFYLLDKEYCVAQKAHGSKNRVMAKLEFHLCVHDNASPDLCRRSKSQFYVVRT